MRSASRVVLAIMGALWVGGCAESANPGLLCGRARAQCGPITDIDSVCGTAGACTVDAAAFVCSGACAYPTGRKVVIDLGASHLDAHQTNVGVLVLSHDAHGVLPASAFAARLDGIDGVLDGNDTFDFPQHAGPPGTLEITATGDLPAIAAHVDLSDQACLDRVERDTPACQGLE
jgi:hypothetical protein